MKRICYVCAADCQSNAVLPLCPKCRPPDARPTQPNPAYWTMPQTPNTNYGDDILPSTI